MTTIDTSEYNDEIAENLLEAFLDAIRTYEPSCDEVHSVLTFILADVMTQMSAAEEDFQEVVNFTVDAIKSAADLQGSESIFVPQSATIN